MEMQPICPDSPRLASASMPHIGCTAHVRDCAVTIDFINRPFAPVPFRHHQRPHCDGRRDQHLPTAAIAAFGLLAICGPVICERRLSGIESEQLEYSFGSIAVVDGTNPYTHFLPKTTSHTRIGLKPLCNKPYPLSIA